MEFNKNKDNIIRLYGSDSFYTHDPDDAFMVTEGQIIIFICAWDKEKNIAGRRCFLGELQEKSVFPAFSYKDTDYRYWRFLIIPKDEEAQLTVMPNSCTNVLKKKFLTSMGVSNWEEEGYESSLVEHYQKEILKGDIFIRRVEETEKENKGKADDVIRDVLNKDNNRVYSEYNSNAYKIIKTACDNQGIELKSEDVLVSRCGRNYTVADAAYESDFICRNVVLDAKWHKEDCGAIIGRIGKEQVACIRKKGKYYVCRESSEEIKPLNRKTAGQIEPEAFSISRALPVNSLSKKDIIVFCKKSILTSDIVRLIILGICGTLIGLLLPTLNQKIYDDYIPTGDYNMLIQMCSLIGSFMVGKLLLNLTKKLTEFRISSKISYELQNAAYYRILQLPESFFRRFDSADLAQRVSQIGTVANTVVTQIVVTGLSAVFSLLYLIRMFKYSSKLTWISFLMVVILAAVLFAFNFISLRYEKTITECDARAQSRLLQYIDAVKKIRLAGAEERIMLEYLKPVTEEHHNAIKKNRIVSVSSVIMEVASYIFSAVLYVIIINGKLKLSTGNFIAFNSAFGTLSAAILELMNAGFTIYSLKPMIDRIKPITATATENDGDKDKVSTLKGEIAVENVTFSYGDDSQKVLKDMSIIIHPGEYVAIVGPSGCGKSTLLKLLLGFERPQRGQISYDSKNIESVDKRSLRRKMGVVLQDGKLISGSIFENITITAERPEISQVNKVLEAVGLKEDIDQMPMGVHTMVSEDGGTISGGQQQRILIARAIINNPAVLFFDEATSALDNITQARVCANLDKMHMTRVVIAHRLSTVKNCDRILVINDGQLVEEGNYEQLMSRKGLFFRMASRQLAE